MPIQKIIEKIEEDTRLEKEKIEKEAREQINKIIEDANKRAESIVRRILEEGRSRIEIETRQIVANARISAKAKIDKEIAMWVENVFEEAKRKILSFSDEEKKKILESLCNIEDKENFDIFVDKKYKHLLKNAYEEEIGDFGVILKSKDGKIKIDNTLSEIFKNLRQTISPEVYEILFKE